MSSNLFNTNRPLFLIACDSVGNFLVKEDEYRSEKYFFVTRTVHITVIQCHYSLYSYEPGFWTVVLDIRYCFGGEEHSHSMGKSQR